jgi:hypothetical protein
MTERFSGRTVLLSAARARLLRPLAVAISLAVIACGPTRTKNLLTNGDMEAWPPGSGSDPVGWSRIAGIGQVEQSASLRHQGAHSAKVMRTTSNVNLQQSIPDDPARAGMAMTCTVWAHTSDDRALRIDVGDGQTFGYSEWHPGDGQWHQLTATFSRGDAAGLRVILDVSRPSTGRVSANGVLVGNFDDGECHATRPSAAASVEQALTYFGVYTWFAPVALAASSLATIGLWAVVRRHAAAGRL